MQFLHPFSKFSFGAAGKVQCLRNSQYTFGNEVAESFNTTFLPAFSDAFFDAFFTAFFMSRPAFIHECHTERHKINLLFRVVPHLLSEVYCFLCQRR